MNGNQDFIELIIFLRNDIFFAIIISMM